jgi:hypothetical protein
MKDPSLFDPMSELAMGGYPGSGGGAPGGGGGGGGGGGAPAFSGGGDALNGGLGSGESAFNDPSNVFQPGVTGQSLNKGAVYDPSGGLLGMNAGTGSEFGGGASYSGQTTPGSFADQQRAIDSRRRGAAPLTMAGLGAYFNNAQGLLSGTGAVMTGGISALEAALGLEPGSLGGIQNIPGYTALPEFTGTPTMAKYQQMVQNAVGGPWGNSLNTPFGRAWNPSSDVGAYLGSFDEGTLSSMYGGDRNSPLGRGWNPNSNVGAFLGGFDEAAMGGAYGGSRGGNAGGGYGQGPKGAHGNSLGAGGNNQNGGMM